MCPNCGKYSLCSCENCAARRDSGERDTPEGLLVGIVLDPVNGELQCPYCGHVHMFYEEEEASWAEFQKSEEYKIMRAKDSIYKQ